MALGALVALIVFIIAFLAAIAVLPVSASLVWWLIAALAFAILIGTVWPGPWPWKRG